MHQETHTSAQAVDVFGEKEEQPHTGDSTTSAVETLSPPNSTSSQSWKQHKSPRITSPALPEDSDFGDLPTLDDGAMDQPFTDSNHEGAHQDIPDRRLLQTDSKRSSINNNDESPSISGIHGDEEEGQDQTEEFDHDIDTLHESLASTVQSIRLRHDEQSHLHQLTIAKIEAVAQRCLSQEAQIRDLVNTISHLRTENQTLLREKVTLQDQVSTLELDRDRREVAVTAMTGAVKGLEGWIEHTAQQQHSSRAATPVKRTPALMHQTTTPTHDPQPPDTPSRSQRPSTSHRRSVIRGRGRFRGRFYLDNENDNEADTTTEQPVNQGTSDALHSSTQYGLHSGAASYEQTQEVFEGVHAWIRGFRDVEECVNGPFDSRYRNDMMEDWGDFEGPAGM